MSISITDGANTLTLTPDKFKPGYIQTLVRNESLTGRIFNKIRKTKKKWEISDIITDTEKATLEALMANNYVNATIESALYYCVMDVESLDMLSGHDTIKLYRLNLTLTERGWTS